jgi:putative endonuclease
MEKRLHQHNTNEVQSTKARKPFNLIYFEEVQSIEDARKREKYFKSGFGRKYMQSKLL